jgi:hypothetical protein
MSLDNNLARVVKDDADHDSHARGANRTWETPEPSTAMQKSFTSESISATSRVPKHDLLNNTAPLKPETRTIVTLSRHTHRAYDHAPHDFSVQEEPALR